MVEMSKRQDSGLENIRQHTVDELKISMDRIAESIKVARQEIVFDLRTLQAGTLRALKFMDQNQKIMFDGITMEQERIKKTSITEKKTQEEIFASIKNSLQLNSQKIENLMIEQEKTCDAMLNQNFECVKKLANEFRENEAKLASGYENMTRSYVVSVERAIQEVTTVSKKERIISNDQVYQQIQNLRTLHETQIEAFTKSHSEVTQEQANLIQKLAEELKKTILIGHEEMSSNEVVCHESISSLYKSESEQILQMAETFFNEINEEQQQTTGKWATLYRLR